MGPSGSGKTTLLASLAHRFEPGLTYRGTIRYDGMAWREYPKLKRKIGFIPQDDVYPPMLTVREHLTFSARLLLNGAVSAKVEEVISLLKLDGCADTQLGSAMMRGVSGGERKRCMIANELLSQPKILFCDEVTSGLDSALSIVVIDVLRELAEVKGLTVCTTIHQPSSALFSKFMDLMVLDNGKLFYRGEAAKLIEWMAFTLNRPVPPLFNPVDFLMDLLVLHHDELDKDAATTALTLWNDDDAPGAAAVVAPGSAKPMLFAQGSLLHVAGQDAYPEGHHEEYSAPMWLQIKVLVQRMWKKNGKEIVTRQLAVSNLSLMVIAGVLFWQIGWSSPSDAFRRTALCYWLIGTDMYLSTFASVFALHEDYAVLRKDLFDDLYSVLSYYVAKSLVVLPVSALWSLFYTTIIVLATGVAPNAAAGAAIVFTLQLCVLMFQACGLALSSLLPMANLVTGCVVLLTFFFAFAGFFAPPSSMLVWYAWLRYPVRFLSTRAHARTRADRRGRSA